MQEKSNLLLCVGLLFPNPTHETAMKNESENGNEKRSGCAPTIVLVLFALVILDAFRNNPMFLAPPMPGEKSGHLLEFKSPFEATGRDAEKQNRTEGHGLPFEPRPYQPQPIDNDPRTQGMFGPGDEPVSPFGPAPYPKQTRPWNPSDGGGP